jgi:hypothetical protein
MRPPGSCRPHSRQPRSSLSPHDALVDIIRSAITDRLDQAAYGAVLAREEAVKAELRRVLLPALHRIPDDPPEENMTYIINAALWMARERVFWGRTVPF